MTSRTKIVMLGTGTPNPVPERSGPCVAVVVDEDSYIVDCGTGVVRQAEKAHRKGIGALDAQNLKRVFLTHLHSDHTIGLPDIIFTPWVLERQEPLKVFGPKGTKEMCEHILAAYKLDIHARMFGLEEANKEGIKVETTEIKEGVVYKDEKVTVEAFRVDHPPFEAYGYRFTTPDKVVVISGDTAPCDNLVKHAIGCNILVHEVYSATGVKFRDPKWHKYHTTVHTSSVAVGEIAAKVKPDLVVFYHQLFMAGQNEAGNEATACQREEEMLKDVQSRFKGAVVSAKDLDIF